MNRDRVRNGCLAVAGVVVLVALGLGAVAGIALVQNRSTVLEHHEVVERIPALPLSGSTDTALLLRLDLHTVGFSIAPLPEGQPIRIDADYDPRRYELRNDTEQVDGRRVVTIGMRPRGSTAMALLRAKLGGEPALVRVGLPRGVVLEIRGQIDRSFVALELGGLSVRSADLRVHDGYVKLSFVEPLPTPMDRLTIRGRRGALAVSGLGNASPREAEFEQRMGAVDLDLRGPWSRDSTIVVSGVAAGGSLWIPADHPVVGLEGHPGVPVDSDPELDSPTLTISISERLGRFVVMK